MSAAACRKTTTIIVSTQIGMLALLAASQIACTRTPKMPEKLPSMILVTLDTTRADRLGCYGYHKDTSPNLDRFAGTATLFELAIAQAAVTPVSHASILTGLNPYHHGLRVLHGLEANRLADRFISMPEIWRWGDAHTAAFVSAFPVTAAFGLNQGFEHFDSSFPVVEVENLLTDKGIVNTNESQRSADLTTDAALEWLNRQPPGGAPLFLWVHYFDPHDPKLLPPSEILERFPPESDDRGDILRAYYDAEIYFMDQELGRLFTDLDRAGIWEESMVIVVSDHGEGLGDHDWWSHGILYQEQIRVPLMIKMPGQTIGKRVPNLVRTIDLLPTVLDVAQVPTESWPRIDGTSLVPLLTTGDESRTRSAYAESLNLMVYGRADDPARRDQKTDKLYCVLDASEKMIWHQLRPWESEFYRLDTDPLELRNLAAEQAEAAKRFYATLEEMGALTDLMLPSGKSDPDVVRKLKSLGYVQ